MEFKIASTVFLVLMCAVTFRAVSTGSLHPSDDQASRFRSHAFDDFVAERPQRPGKTFMEKFFFDGLKHMHKKVKNFPQSVLVKVPFPGVPIYETNRDAEVEGRKIREKLYDAVEKYRGDLICTQMALFQ